MAGTVRCTRTSLGSTCLSSVRDECEYVRPRQQQQQLEGCSAYSWLPPRFARSTTTKVGPPLSRGNRWKVTLAREKNEKRPIFRRTESRIEAFDSISLGRGTGNNCIQRNEGKRDSSNFLLSIYAIPPRCYSIILSLSRLFRQ